MYDLPDPHGLAAVLYADFPAALPGWERNPDATRAAYVRVDASFVDTVAALPSVAGAIGGVLRAAVVAVADDPSGLALPVRQAERLTEAAHPGAVLLAGTDETAFAHALPGGVTLRDWGSGGSPTSTGRCASPGSQRRDCPTGSRPSPALTAVPTPRPPRSPGWSGGTPNGRPGSWVRPRRSASGMDLLRDELA